MAKTQGAAARPGGAGQHSSGTPLQATDILVDRTDPAVAVVTINRPAKKNCMTLAMWQRLGEAFDGLGRDDAVRVIILTGAGGSFCSGADISEFHLVRDTVEQATHYEHVVDFCSRAIEGSPKATIAAIEGFCVGGGFGLAQCCDFRVAREGASFGIPAARLGLVYNTIECRNLMALVGITKAKEILFTGDRFDAAEALSIGFADRVTDGAAVDAARAFAARMSGNAPLTIAGCKVVLGAILRAADREEEAAILAAMDRAIASEDYKEGRKAFAEKRPPRFKGR